MDEFLNMVESFCNNGGFLQIGLRDPEYMQKQLIILGEAIKHCRMMKK